jgi:AAA15 family ATPase/GTPase
MKTERASTPGGSRALFDLDEETDGVLRLLSLAPMIHLARTSNAGMTFVVDEFTRSLHPLVARMFIREFLAQGGGSQLILTTHDTSLLDLCLMRRDAIMLVSRDARGNSEVTSLVDYGARAGRHLGQDYLLGRFGGIPILGDGSSFDVCP